MDVSPLSTGALTTAPASSPPPPAPTDRSGATPTTVPFSAGALAVSYEHATSGQSADTTWATYEHLAVSSSYASTGGSAVGKLADQLTNLVTRLANGDHTPSLDEIEHKVAHLLRHALRHAAAAGQPFSLDVSVHVDESAGVHLTTTANGTQTDVVAAEARSFDLELHVEAGGAVTPAVNPPSPDQTTSAGPSPAVTAPDGPPPPTPNSADGTRRHHGFGFGNGAFADLVRQLAAAIQDALSKLAQPAQVTPPPTAPPPATEPPTSSPSVPPAVDVAA